MRRSVIGLGFCTIGAALYALNYCLAVQHLPQVHEWRTSVGRNLTSYIEVGYHPTITGGILFILGIIFIVRDQRDNR